MARASYQNLSHISLGHHSAKKTKKKVKKIQAQFLSQSPSFSQSVVKRPKSPNGSHKPILTLKLSS